ncbi:endonuclease/exonuclease/phosphatase family protein, partial [Trifolium medium]|nr:endonuclease/exonuclease/phosphatase family protein [Trifolium medium]
LDEFPKFKFTNAIADTSDHSPILLKLINAEMVYKPRVFKFENAWLEEHDLDVIVKGAWNREGYTPLISKLRYCTEDLEDWGSRLRSRFTKSISEYRKEMEQNQDSSNELCIRKYQEAREKLGKVLKQEEDYWKQ